MERRFTLRNGIEIPQIGYGSAIVLTYMYDKYSNKTIIKYWVKNILKNKAQVKKDRGLKKILQADFLSKPLLIDTSRAYAGSEKMIGDAIRKNGRENFFITTKVCNNHQYSETVEEGLNESLRNLGTNYVDLYLMHWPVSERYIDTWKKMEKIYKEGKVKAIGVCNCNIRHLEEIKKNVEIMPMVNQFECHPLFTQKELVEYCANNDIQVMSYTPTGRMDERLSKTVIPKLAEKYKKNNAQIIIKWHIQTGKIPIVNTSNVEHFQENFDVYDFQLLAEEIEAIDKININSRLRYDPENCDFTQL